MTTPSPINCSGVPHSGAHPGDFVIQDESGQAFVECLVTRVRVELSYPAVLASIVH